MGLAPRRLRPPGAAQAREETPHHTDDVIMTTERERERVDIYTTTDRGGASAVCEEPVHNTTKEVRRKRRPLDENGGPLRNALYNHASGERERESGRAATSCARVWVSRWSSLY